MPLQREDKFIVFDRYYFDFIVDQKRSALNTSEKFSLIVYNFLVPKPNKVFFIKSDAVDAYNRKREISVEEIKNINIKYENLVQIFDYFEVIENHEIESAYHNFLKSFIKTISSKVRHDQ